MNIDISEKDLSEKMGLSRDEMRQWRSKLPEAASNLIFQQESKKPKQLWNWYWTPAGVSWLTDQLNLQTDSVKQEIYEENKPEEKEVEVVRHNFPNLRFVLVKDKNDKVFSASCKDNRGFRVKMKITVKEDKHGWYVKRNPIYRENG